ncbi:F0F1 ATP synthase subunit delta [Georgenia sp. TF02-10]|uniref:F0F1 ATP synthase subunit delta n=1 Tax=Georgenia sp. TF02-10 TaxID=2917725 RepID=UPI001FA76ADF|nr:F0F1 ATP synthase subunit delta [Georgenia sp. TF02-10]UNX53977.1 F0F1 ATP synthase subunit delta [Georgenia sp. TF02-10]
MRATSQAAVDRALERWEPVLHEVGAGAAALGEELFAVVDLLDGAPRLRRALTEPTRDGAAKARLAGQVLGGKVAPEVVDLLGGLVRERWSDDGDLPDAVERLAVTSVLAAADRAGRLADVEDETFRLGRVLAEARELRLALADRTAGADRRAGLMAAVIAGKVAPETEVLAVRAARAPRRPVTAALRLVTEAAAERRQHLVAAVTAAVPLSREQVQRLAAVLGRRYGRPVRVHVGIAPEVVGGLRVQVGDDVVDGTLAARLADARRRLVR